MTNRNTLLTPETKDTLQALQTYILHNLDKTLTIESLTKQTGLNPSKLKAAFSHFAGQTIHQYIIQQRLQKATELLQSTNKPMKEIASLVGYSERNFYALFQKHKHCSPHSLRSFPVE
ncbi:MAG TPA: AraC family transcriptional regulator [Flavisolibacter sp.]|nr:AraC family transcriptional regulator [Flavisolibacter sp.]